ncbi:MAG: TauD/TfdA family dioxygenase [Alphaproteobacteria bacterium]|nr:TauD/TfdA family dioxygenase [Alphaproteobacteria bacterium]
MPAPIASPASWRGSTLDWRKDALHVFAPAEIAEIDAGLAHLRSLGDLDFPEITPATFPLPTVGGYFARLREELRFGRGFVLLRGLPRERYSVDDLARIYYGFGAHLGAPGPQSWQGELLGNVIDVSDIEADPRGYHKGGRQNFHTDSCDVVALLCLRAAKSGGKSRIASSVGIHDAIVERRPDIARRLYRGYRYRRMDLDAQFGEGVVVSPEPVPIYVRRGDELSSYYMLNYARQAAARGESVLEDADREALDEIQRLAGSDEFYLDMSIDEGDIQFLNNRIMLHSRTEYEDHPEVARRRHMLRLWLQMPSWPAMPQEQVLHTAADRRLWLRQRKARMEFPSAYLAEMARYLEEGRKLVAAAA